MAPSLLFGLCLLRLCTAHAQEPLGYQLSFPAMGTLVQLEAYEAEPQVIARAFDAARGEVARLEAILSDYDPESDLSRWQRSVEQAEQAEQVGRELVAVAPELMEVMWLSDHWYRVTGGAFDAAIGQLTRLGRKARRAGRVPSAAEYRQALEHSGWDKVLLDDRGSRAGLVDSRVRIDFGGIAKGYIIDRAFERLTEHGISRCLVNAGGDMRLGDPPPGRGGWRVEVAGLAVDQPGLRRLELSRCALATSGDLWQYQSIDGVRRSHIVDPRTGVGVPGPISVTVVAALAVEADAAATALTVMPPEAGFSLVASREGVEAMWVRSMEQGGLLWRATPGWAAWNVQP